MSTLSPTKSSPLAAPATVATERAEALSTLGREEQELLFQARTDDSTSAFQAPTDESTTLSTLLLHQQSILL